MDTSIKHLLRVGAFIFLLMLGVILAWVDQPTAIAANQTKAEIGDFYISPTGNDQWSGELPSPNETKSDGPFATLARARDAVRQLRQGGNQGDVRVLLRGGAYRLSSTVVFTLEDSAPEGHTTAYAAFGEETPVITSAVPIGGWKKPEIPSPLLPAVARDNVWTAEVPKEVTNVLTLYDGTQSLRRAWSKPFTPTVWANQESTPDQMSFPPGAMRNWPDLRNGELRVIPSCDYEMCLLPLAEVDEVAGLAKTTVPASRSMGKVKFLDETVWVENILEVLDEPGEWVFSSTERKLYLWPVGDAPSEAIVAPKLTELVRVEGKIDYNGPVDETVKGLVFQGLTFTCGERRPWSGATKGELQHKWEHFDSPTALLRFRGAQGCAVQSCRFIDTGGTGLRLDLTCLENRIIDNEVARTGGVGILLAGYGPGTKDVNKNNEVSNNWIHQVGQNYWASPALMVWQSGENKVTRNLIHNTPYSAITVSGRTGWTSDTESTFRAHEVVLPEYKWLLPGADSGSSSIHQEWWILREKYMHARKNFVAHNDIHDIMEVMGDGNGVYVSGSGKENHIYRNYIHHIDGDGVAGGIRCDNDQYETIIEGNVLYKVRSAQSGIATTEMNHIINNMIVDVIPSRRPITEPNIVHGYIAVPDPTWPLEGARIQRNIIWSPRPDYWPIVEHRSFATGAGDRLKNTETDYNLYWCPDDPQWGQRHIDDQKRNGVELHSLSADPMFVDLESGDLRLKPESPAFKLGFEPIDMTQVGLMPDHPYFQESP